MTLSILEAKRLRTLVKRLMKAEREDAWKGAQHPDDWRDIELELDRARRALNDFINKQSTPETS